MQITWLRPLYAQMPGCPLCPILTSKYDGWRRYILIRSYLICSLMASIIPTNAYNMNASMMFTNECLQESFVVSRIIYTPGPGTINICEHVSLLNSQSVFRNDVTLCALHMSLRFVLSLYSPGPRMCSKSQEHMPDLTENKHFGPRL